MEYTLRKTDVLILGAGIAGLEAAWTASEAGAKVLVLNKGANASSSVLGFNAPVDNRDSVNLLSEDTYNGGWQLGKSKLINALAEDSIDIVTHLESLGLSFDRYDTKDAYHLMQPLGCTVPRLIHYRNITGRESMMLLKEKLLQKGIEFINHTMATELIVKNGSVCGSSALDLETGKPVYVLANAVVLATGGGHLMENSTYPLCETADGYAMAYHAGAQLIDMEFIQYEPCRAVWPKPLGLSTTVLAKGGKLTNRLGERFVLKNFDNEGMAPKDVLAQLIFREILEGRGTPHSGVYLDLTSLPKDEIKINHVLYYERFAAEGIDLTRDIIEVGPAAHSILGGIDIDTQTFTGVPGLFAAGEVIGGLHGANRLGGNAGAEIFVFGRRAGRAAAAWKGRVTANETDIEKAATLLAYDQSAPSFDFAASQTDIRSVLSAQAGAVRQADHLQNAIAFLEHTITMLKSTAPNSPESVRMKLETFHMAEVGLMICRAALVRQESRGVHYRADFPEKDDVRWKKHVLFDRRKGMYIL